MKTIVLRYRLSAPTDFGVKVCAVIMAVGGMVFFVTQPVAGIVLIIAGIFPFLYFKCLEINLYKGTYSIGLNVLGYTIGQKEPYPGAAYIFLKKNRTIHRSDRHTWNNTASVSFDCYLLLEDGMKILLSQDAKKEITLLRVQPFAQELHIEVKDLT